MIVATSTNLMTRQESQRAFTLLNKKIRPIAEHLHKEEFKDLTFLLVTRSIGEVFPSWPGIQAARLALIQGMVSLYNLDSPLEESQGEDTEGRLVDLLKQAMAYQVEFSKYHPTSKPRVTSLLRDFECLVVPSHTHSTMGQGKRNIKCVAFVGTQGERIAAGGSSNDICLFDTGLSTCATVLKGHTSRVWDLACAEDASWMCSVAGDGCCLVWDLEKETFGKLDTQHVGDVYSVEVCILFLLLILLFLNLPLNPHADPSRFIQTNNTL